MQHGCSNPVMYFDELDKISGTPHGEEIASMLIHLTDRTQNTQFHDRYFAGIDIDVSQCLFVFSFNDINLVNPILRDRMQVIHCGGYSEVEKQVILKDYVWPSILKNLKFSNTDVILGESYKFMVREFSSKEQGIRTLIRCAETILTRLNILRIADEETTSEYKFYIPVKFPLTLTDTIIKKLMSGVEYREPELWKTMYT
jgi:ATP-dependent Lon protease